MTDHPPNPSEHTDQGANSPSAPGSPQPGKAGQDPAEIAPGMTAEKEDHNTEGREGEMEGTVKEEEQTGKQKEQEVEEGEAEDEEEEGEASAPPLPDEVPPPLPNEAPPGEDDGWEPVWDANAQAYYFYNRFTGVAQWENPRIPDADKTGPPGVEDQQPKKAAAPVAGGYNPAIHGDYDPTAPYAQPQHEEPTDAPVGGGAIPVVDPSHAYVAAGTFNRFTGKWQDASVRPENHNDENKSQRQMNAFFDVDAAANSHDGRSLRAERSAKRLSKQELKAFKEKRREKKEEKRRAWLRD